MLAAVAAFISLFCWAISSPPGSGADEPFHLNSIWCGHGDDADTCLPTGDDAVRSVPHQLSSSACFTQNSALGGSCRAADLDDALTPDAPTAIGNWNGHGYPRLYYFVMSAFAGDSLDVSVLAVRVFNCLLTVLLVAGLARLLPRRLRSVAPVAFLATAVPLSLFYFASANPSAWATISAGTTWLAFYGAYETRGRQHAALLTLGVVAAVMGSGARTDAALFTVMGLALALGMRLGELRAQWKPTLVAALTAVLALVLYFTSANSAVTAGGLGGYEPVAATDLVLFASNALQLPFIWMSALGVGPMSSLGWFDTPMPWVVGFGSAFVFAVLCFQGWASMWWNKAVALVLLALALTAYPLVILQQSHIFAGNGVQPRYLLPMMVMFAGISLLPAMGRTLTVNRAQFVVLTLLLSAAQSVALYVNLWRYVQGINGPIRSIDTYSWWWGGLFPSPMAIWVIGSCAFATTTALLLFQLVPPRDRVAPVEAERTDEDVPAPTTAAPVSASAAPGLPGA